MLNRILEAHTLHLNFFFLNWLITVSQCYNSSSCNTMVHCFQQPVPHWKIYSRYFSPKTPINKLCPGRACFGVSMIWLCGDVEGSAVYIPRFQFLPKIISQGLQLGWEATWVPTHTSTPHTFSMAGQRAPERGQTSCDWPNTFTWLI